MIGDLFSTFEAARAASPKKTLAEQIRMELALHSMIADEVFTCRAQPVRRAAGTKPPAARPLGRREPSQGISVI
jgi:hypothetical protein